VTDQEAKQKPVDYHAPWFCSKYGVGEHDIIYIYCTVGPNQPSIANVHHRPFYARGDDLVSETIAYGHLIAAAPEMLKALKNVRKIPRPWMDGNATGDEWLAACDAVESAIAKAEGRAQ
jgi:hypothetical protein